LQINNIDNSLIEKNITSLPKEIILKILSYLSYSNLKTLKFVNKFFRQISRDPTLLKFYVISNNKRSTNYLINELKRLFYLEKFTTIIRNDTDYILRQLSLNNKYLKILCISNQCTVLPIKRNLRSLGLTRILERCQHLHSIRIIRCRLRGLKFYQLLGKLGLQIKFIDIHASPAQFRTFITFATYINENDRQYLILNIPKRKINTRLKYKSHTITISWRNHFTTLMGCTKNYNPKRSRTLKIQRNKKYMQTGKRFWILWFGSVAYGYRRSEPKGTIRKVQNSIKIQTDKKYANRKQVRLDFQSFGPYGLDLLYPYNRFKP
ncbi:uncharacterized protein LOC127281232, partial [Leptopilina boulardi]|uniref:uncharacterized protein LOC127281232 n=1 Tax=Leptopilina boulardi TaxID=63433 RepID=UPI0021F56392